MKVVSIFNNKGGVGKTTLTFHLGHALSSLNKKTLFIDLDPQCNLSINCLNEVQLEDIWNQEDEYIDDYSRFANLTKSEQKTFLENPRSVHFLIKSVEDGVDDVETLPPPIEINDNLHLLPGRLTLYTYEDKIAERWNALYKGENLSIRTIVRIRELAEYYSEQYGYEYVIVDTSPTLGLLNKVIISTVDGFVVPCNPDMFSLYGIKNIGSRLSTWKKDFDIIFKLIGLSKREKFPKHFVQFIGYAIYNASKRSDADNPYEIPQAHYIYARQIPQYIRSYIASELRNNLSDALLKEPLGKNSVIHSHNAIPNFSHKYKYPIWDMPNHLDEVVDDTERATISMNKNQYYYPCLKKYQTFAKDLMRRLSKLT